MRVEYVGVCDESILPLCEFTNSVYVPRKNETVVIGGEVYFVREVRTEVEELFWVSNPSHASTVTVVLVKD